MAFWGCCRLELRREALGVDSLARAGFAPYYPQIREHRIGRAGRRVPVIKPLFSGYCFIVIELQWHSARWAPGVLDILQSGGGDRPARVPDCIIDELRNRERHGLIELASRPRFQRGDEVRITSGMFFGAGAIVEGMRPRDRVAVLLAVLGRVTLPAAAVERA